MPDTPPPPLPKISRIAILGGGPSGLTCLSRFLRFRPTGHFPTIHLFEQRPHPGGVWNATPHLTHSVSLTPSTTIPLCSPTSEGALSQDQRYKGEYVSAMYPGLVANIPKQLMGFHDFPFGDEVELFPDLQKVREYLWEYGRKVEREAGEGCVFYGKRVEKVEKLQGGGWEVEVSDVETGEIWDGRQGGGEEGGGDWKQGKPGGRYDAVVVATGRYTVPYVPDISGLREFVESGWGRVEHARDFRGGEEFKGKTIILIGSSVSAGDLLRLLLPHAAQPIYQSTRSHLTDALHPSIRLIPQIHSIENTSPPRLHFVSQAGEDSGGVQETQHPPLEIPKDAVLLFCTGYLLTAPYLRIDPPTPAGASEVEAVDTSDSTTTHNDSGGTHEPPNPQFPVARNGTYVPNLLLHTVYGPQPTLAFLGLPFKVIPFTVAALQAAVVARVWAGLVAWGEVVEWVSNVGGGGGGEGGGGDWKGAQDGLDEVRGKRVHCFGYPRDAGYVDLLAGLCGWVDGREREREVEGDEEEAEHWALKRPYISDYPRWGKRERWLRKVATGEMRGRFLAAVSHHYNAGGGGVGVGGTGVLQHPTPPPQQDDPPAPFAMVRKRSRDDAPAPPNSTSHPHPDLDADAIDPLDPSPTGDGLALSPPHLLLAQLVIDNSTTGTTTATANGQQERKRTLTPVSRKLSVPMVGGGGSGGSGGGGCPVITRVEQLGMWFDEERWDREEAEAEAAGV